jgi:hypothetical protein
MHHNHIKLLLCRITAKIRGGGAGTQRSENPFLIPSIPDWAAVTSAEG